MNIKRKIEAREMKKLVTGPIRFYQKRISPHTPPSCRYHPTCSTYALQAVEKHGALKGSVMGLARIIRCNPMVSGGVDEVPDYFTVRRNPDNVDDYHVPEFLMPAEKEVQENLDRLLRKYKDQLVINKNLPEASITLQEIATLKELLVEDIQAELTEEELGYLEEVEIFPDLHSEEYRYFTLEKTEKNKRLLKNVEPFFEGTDFGTEYPLIVLEKTGIWYTNMPIVEREFLMNRGVTEDDLKYRSYHLWLVLQAFERSEENKN